MDLLPSFKIGRYTFSEVEWGKRKPKNLKPWLPWVEDVKKGLARIQ